MSNVTPITTVKSTAANHSDEVAYGYAILDAERQVASSSDPKDEGYLEGLLWGFYHAYGQDFDVVAFLETEIAYYKANPLSNAATES